MPKIERQIEVLADTNRVWHIISDLENEGEYWYGTKEVRTISRSENVIEREIIQNFRNHKILQRAILRPNELEVEIRYLKGLTEGTKLVSIEQLGPSRLKLKVAWDVRYTGVYYLLTPYLKGHTDKGTVSALERIKQAAERVQNDQGNVQS